MSTFCKMCCTLKTRANCNTIQFVFINYLGLHQINKLFNILSFQGRWQWNISKNKANPPKSTKDAWNQWQMWRDKQKVFFCASLVSHYTVHIACSNVKCPTSILQNILHDWCFKESIAESCLNSQKILKIDLSSLTVKNDIQKKHENG